MNLKFHETWRVEAAVRTARQCNSWLVYLYVLDSELEAP